MVAACDSKTLIRFNTNGELELDSITVGVYITALSWQPIPSGQKIRGDQLLAAVCSDGIMKLFKTSSTGKAWSLTEDKNTKAHDGAAISVKWDWDGSSLSTSGEDGEVKIWSRTGHLRTKLEGFNTAVNCTAWSPDSVSIVDVGFPTFSK